MDNDRRRQQRKRKRQRALIIKCIVFVALIVILIFAIKFVMSMGRSDKTSDSSSVSTSAASESSTTQASSDPSVTQTPSAVPGSRDDIINQAKTLAVQYDYDGAINLLSTVENYTEDADIISLLAEYEAAKSNLVATSPYNVTHIFFHSLVVDPARGFSLTGDSGWDNGTAGFCQWMTTVDEFNAIMNQMYERGYVLVSINDLVDKTTDENGVVHITAKDIYLPQGKIPFVLSLDDLSYYHSYDGRGCATKMIVGEDGTPTCEYVDANGEGHVGSYDCVPLLDDFIEQHPDFSYKNAKGTIALTGYNGILGYRTDYCYRDRVDLTSDQQAWLDANPNFDWNAECEQAKQVADAIKADGWTFASHTWGHIRIGDASLESLQTDTQKWLDYVKPLIGDTDIIIFAHGQDLANWDEDYASTAKFQYLKSVGFDIYCNVDSTQYFVQIEDQFLRMGRRNLDGYRLWQAVYGGNDKVSDLIDAASVFDPNRPTDASLYQL
ncbi:MAG: polysaccharide deacetylase [Candidatus Alectryocaccobium sp.]|jgi:hypothetical protein|nr:polysaccharide deacetylase [Lachnospiraceae bacterium]MDY6221774.1 polysaccharide deacetylase [Candidatus Alectryocaccobium sp.]